MQNGCHLYPAKTFNVGAASDFAFHARLLKTCFIVNPRSGRAVKALPQIRTFATRHGTGLHLTERPRHATELARRALADGCELIVAVGGDGTMNEVATTLVGTGATFGLVPCGSGDGLGRHLGIHGSIARALEILHCGRPQLVDAGLADGHSFFTAAGIGFEAEIAHRFNQLSRRGFARYVSTAASVFHRWQPEEYTISHGNHRERVRSFTLAVANANQYGNNALIAPDARVDDGRLDLCAVPPVGFWNALPLVAGLFRGSIGRVRGVRLWQADRFVVERAGSGWLHTDGELHEAGPRIEFAVRPSSLRVMVPA